MARKPDQKPVKSEWVARKCRQKCISWRAFKNRTEAHHSERWFKGLRSGIQETDLRGCKEPKAEISGGWYFPLKPETLVCVYCSR